MEKMNEKKVVLEHYKEESTNYDAERKCDTYHNRKERDMVLQYTTGKKVLELCCGTGRFAEWLQDYDYTGIDFSKEMLDVAKKKNLKSKFILMDVDDIDKLEEKYDTIFVTRALKFWLNPQQVIDKCYDLLNDGGVLIINSQNLNYLPTRILYWLDKRGIKFKRSGLRCRHVGTEKYYYPIEIKVMMNKFKEVRQVEYIGKRKCLSVGFK